MEKLHKLQIAKIIALLFCLILIPFISSSMRSSYLYFLLNLLIVVLAMDSGLVGALSGPTTEEKKPVIISTTTAHSGPRSDKANDNSTGSTSAPPEKPAVVAEKVVKVERVRMQKKCPSMPSLFFIGSYEDVYESDAEEEDGEVSSDELFARAEMFIGNFYKQ